MFVVLLVLSGCGRGGDELTIEEQLEKLAGRDLTTAEVEEQLAMADLMCGFDGRVLTEIWDKLDARQLEFQDFVFGQRCPDRLSTLSDARDDMGTVPPDALTTTSRPTTTRRTTTRPPTSRSTTTSSSTRSTTTSSTTTTSTSATSTTRSTTPRSTAERSTVGTVSS